MNAIVHIVEYKGIRYIFDNYDAALHFKGQKKTAVMYVFASIPVECGKLLDTNRKLNRRLQVVEHRAAKWRRRYVAVKEALADQVYQMVKENWRVEAWCRAFNGEI